MGVRFTGVLATTCHRRIHDAQICGTSSREDLPCVAPVVNPVTYCLLLAYDELLYLVIALLSAPLELLSLALLIFSQALL